MDTADEDDELEMLTWLPYHLPHAYRNTVWQELEEMVAQEVIKPTTIEWVAPIVMVQKKDGSIRLYVNYRQLNAVSMVDGYLMP